MSDSSDRRNISSHGLNKLRRLVLDLHETPEKRMPHADIVKLATEFEEDADVTIDFEASEELGSPMIVLQVSPDGEDLLANLTRREKEVAALIAEGLSNQLIADKLCLALSTVKDHVHNILEKTGLPNRAAIAAACR